MGEREVVGFATERPASEVARWLLPLLKEYAEKLADVAARTPAVLEKLTPGYRAAKPTAALEAGRLICLYDTLKNPATELAREASGLIEHAGFVRQLRSELKLRLDELEEHLRFASVMAGELTSLLTKTKSHADWLRRLVEDSGRYKAPF
jgi:hypothetical protein